MADRTHWTCDFERCFLTVPGIREISVLGFGVWTPRRPHKLEDHCHPDNWEIHFVVHGQILQKVENQTFLMTDGDVMIAAPGMVHSGINRVRHRCELCWIGVHLNPRAALPGLSRAETARLHLAFCRLGAKPFHGDPGLLPAFAGLMREAKSESDASRRLCRSYLHVILTLVGRGRTLDGARTVEPSPAVARAATMLSERLDFPLRIASLSQQVGLRRSALNRRFIAEMGVTPAEFRMQARLEASKLLLVTSNNQDVAKKLGFSSSQYFITMFRRAFGMTPGAWRSLMSATPTRSSVNHD